MTNTKSKGRLTSRHVILRQLGHGNLTRVFLAAPRGAARAEPVVLEVLHPELAKDDDFRAMFLDQAATTLSLRHPNIVRTLDVIADPDGCGLTLEFLQGQTLARVLERVGRQRFPVDLHLHVLSKVLAALAYAHGVGGPGRAEPGFMHRDVCPSSVFITYDGQIKLLGTGFADAVQALEARLARPLMDAKYAAPEVLLGYPSGPSADLFGVGVMLWEAVTRQARLSSDDAKLIIRRRTRGEEPDLESAWPDAPLPLIALCSRALAVSPRERYPTAQAFRADLDAYLGRAAETSEEVLQRLPELMAASFGPEREQMRLFIGARLELADDEPASLGTSEADDALTPHEEEWRAETSTSVPQPSLDALEPTAGVARTGLRRARPEAAPRRDTGTQESPHRRQAEPPLPFTDRRAQPERRSVVERRSPSRPALEAAPGPERAAAAERPPASARAEPPSEATSLLPFEAPPPGDATTGRHRAYSSSLDLASRARSVWRLSPDVLGAAALLLGSLVAAYSVHRHSLLDKKPESEKLAIQAEGREPPARQPSGPSALAGAAPGGGAPERVDAPARRAAAIEPARATPDAGTSEGSAPTPAFFDGQSTSNARPEPSAAAPLRADELPTVDPELTSLQDAIVVAAKAQRFASKHKREKRTEPAPRPSPVEPMLPRPIDEADPYTEPSP